MRETFICQKTSDGTGNYNESERKFAVVLLDEQHIYIYIYTNFQTLCSLNHHHICQVVRAFDGLAMCDLSNGMRVGDSTQQSAEIRLLRRMAFGYNSEFLSHTSLNE